MSDDNDLACSKAGGALIGVIATAVAYALAYNYEVGYTSYFGVTSTLVEISLRSIVLSLVTLAGLVGSALFLEYIAYSFVEERFKARTPLVIRGIAFMAFVSAGIALLSVGSLWFYASVALASATFATFLLVGFWKVSDGKKSYAAKLDLFDRYTRLGYPGSGRLIWIGLFTAALAQILIIAAQEAGRRAAGNQERFMIANVVPPCIVIRSYAENFICVQYDGIELAGKVRLLPVLRKLLYGRLAGDKQRIA